MKDYLLSIDLDDDAITEVARCANDEFCCMDSDGYDVVFFFGKLVNDDPFGEDLINERKYYTECRHCGKLHEFKKKPFDGDYFTCPNCDVAGHLYDFRDKHSLVNENCTLNYGYLEKLDKGYVLRLFDVWLDYSDRDMSDYTSFNCSPDIVVSEVGREYWYEGKVKYYENIADANKAVKFKAVDTIDDESCVIVNYSDDFNDSYFSQCIGDIVYEYSGMPFMDWLSLRCNYRTFKTLLKYGFEQLTYDYIYVPDIFGDSKKISEVLGLDYNKVIADIAASDLGATDLLSMRELQKYGLDFSLKNVRIMDVLSKKTTSVFTKENARKTFKYLRNQMSRSLNVQIPRDYYDYIMDCRKLGLDTDSSEIRYPTDLQKAHERTTMLIRIEVNKETDMLIREVYDRCRQYCEYTDGKFCIVMPACCEDIIREGKEQSHCVGNYCERMAKGEDIILFLRKIAEPDKSFYTVEIRPNMKKLDIVQCRGSHNSDKTKSVEKFLKRYESWFNHRKCDVDTKTCRKYYKAVCKLPDGRYISHWDNKTEYRVGEIIEATMDMNPDRTAVQGIHIASLEFAKNYGDLWDNAAILEIEVDMRDVVVPNAKDQLRTKRGKVLREVPMSELGDWGVRHSKGAAA